MKKALVSVIIPVYNTGKACLELLDSLEQSSYKNLEIICVDDGSKDDSYKMLSAYAAQHKNIVLHKQKNAGPSAARNAGLELATGDYVMFIDSDDAVDRSFVDKMVAATGEKTILACCSIRYLRVRSGESRMDYTKKLRVRKPGESIKEYVLYMMLQDGRLYSSTNKIYRRDILTSAGLKFDTTFDFAEDTKFALWYIDAAATYYPKNATIKTIYEPLYTYNYGTETSTVSKSSLKWSNWRKSYDDLRVWLGAKPSLTARWRKFLLLCRWRISHALAVARSGLKFSQKLKYANIFELVPACLIIKFRH